MLEICPVESCPLCYRELLGTFGNISFKKCAPSKHQDSGSSRSKTNVLSKSVAKVFNFLTFLVFVFIILMSFSLTPEFMWLHIVFIDLDGLFKSLTLHVLSMWTNTEIVSCKITTVGLTLDSNNIIIVFSFMSEWTEWWKPGRKIHKYCRRITNCYKLRHFSSDNLQTDQDCRGCCCLNFPFRQFHTASI